MKSSRVKVFLGILLGVFFPLIILVTAIEVASFDKVFFMKQIESNHVVENTKINEEDIETVIDEIYAFLRGNKEDFDIQARLLNSSERVSIFNEQEIVHMEDVRNLLDIALLFRNIAGLISLGIFIYLFKKERMILLRSFFWGSLIFLGILGIIGGYFLLDFNGAFTLFHQIAFSNNLWIMNPDTDLLIWIVPEPFFLSLINRIIIYTIVPLLLVCLSTGIYLKGKTNILRKKLY
ncbi:MAG: TIGR01906 family membrane protein [Eubacteriaceae bacterium]